MDLISVILPFYNAEKTLERAVQSIRNQTYPNWELLLIDNNSTDGSGEVAGASSAQDSRIRVIMEERHGVVYAANTGMQAARGPYLARMDADDYALPIRLEKQIYFLHHHEQVGVVSGQVVYHGADGGYSRYVDWANQLISHQQIYLNRFVELPVPNPSLMVRRGTWDRVGIYERGSFPEDYQWFLRALEKGVQFGKVTEAILKWHDSESRLTRTHPAYSPDSFYSLKAEFMTRWLKQNHAEKEIWIWGGGKQARRRSSLLERSGIQISGIIDVKSRHIAGRQFLHYQDLTFDRNRFILSYVGNWGAGSKIRSFLLDLGYQEGKNFLMVA